MDRIVGIVRATLVTVPVPEAVIHVHFRVIALMERSWPAVPTFVIPPGHGPVGGVDWAVKGMAARAARANGIRSLISLRSEIPSPIESLGSK